MTRQTQFVLAVLLMELLSVAVAIPLMRWDAVSAGLAATSLVRRVTLVQLVETVWPPLGLILVWVAGSRRLASTTPRLADNHRGYTEAALLAAGFFLLAMQGWFASHLGHGRATGFEPVARMAAIFAGLLMATQGNFTAKASPPTGERAPDPASWGRVMRRCGWAQSLAGLAVAIGAVALPPAPMAFVFLAAWLLAMGYLLTQRRALHRPATA